MNRDFARMTDTPKPIPTVDLTSVAIYEAFGRVKPVLDALHEVIKAAGPNGIPSGRLYAQLMSRVSLDEYEWLINTMVKAGGITNTNHLLVVK